VTPSPSHPNVRRGGWLSGLPVATSRTALWVVVVVGIVLLGTAGYVILEGWSIEDSLYMTVITLTTVGFREVRPLDELGQVWTMLLAVTAVALIFGTIGLVAEAIVTDAASGKREAKRMQGAVDQLSGHYLVCGYGRVGSTVARELAHSGQRVVVIDVKAESLATAQSDGHLVIAGDATDDATLRRAGIERARGLITSIDSDALNVYVTLSSRSLNPGLFIVGRANAEGSEAKLLQAGADRVVSPYSMAGRRIAELAIRPRVADFIDAALSHGQLAFSLEEVEVAAGGPLDGVTVGALRSDGIFLLAIVRDPNEYVPNPPDDRTVHAGESLIVSGSAETLQQLRARV
jgi:voltage-gated potassium channel